MKKAFALLLIIWVSPAFAEGALKNAWAAAWNDFWWTPAQQGQRAFDRGDFELAAKHYRDPMRIGIAYFQATEFDMAAAAFGRVDSPEGAFNRGTALVMQGQYAAALGAFDRALAERPDWSEARENRAIAQARMDKLDFDDDQRAEESGIGADEVVFDQKKSDNDNQDEVTVDSSQSLSDQELRALWLRKSQTSPAVFLKARFSAQLATASAKPEEQ